MESSVTESGVDIVESRDHEGLGFLLKARPSGRLFRVRPARDPVQPRFWCVLVFRCSPGGAPDPDERPWVGAGGMTRDEIPAKLATIRADVGAWLAEPQCHELRDWILAHEPAPAPPGASRVLRPDVPRGRATSRDTAAEPVSLARRQAS